MIERDIALDRHSTLYLKMTTHYRVRSEAEDEIESGNSALKMRFKGTLVVPLNLLLPFSNSLPARGTCAYLYKNAFLAVPGETNLTGNYCARQNYRQNKQFSGAKNSYLSFVFRNFYYIGV